MNIQNIPSEIQSLRQWVCSFPGSKLPMMSNSNDPASTANPDTWSTFQDAVQAVEHGIYSDIGFVFANSDIVGIDLDDAFDEDGFLTELASDIIGQCKSYTEISRSGTGIHILIKGELPFGGRNNRNGVEIYKQGRYFIMTGNTLLYKDIEHNQEAIDYVLDKYFTVLRQENDTDSQEYEYRIYNPEWTKNEGKIKLRPIYPRIPDGCRNICLTSLAGMMHNQGYTARQIYDELVYCNKVACEPMLYDRELQTIVRSVTRYKR